MLLAVALAAVLAAPGADPCAPGAARAQIAADLAAVRKEAAAVTPREGTEGDWRQGLAYLDEAEAALHRGRAYLALDRLTAARLLLRPLRTVAERSGQAKEGVEALRAELAALAPELARPSPSILPLAVRAFRDEARVQAPVYGATLPAWQAIGDGLGALFYGAQGLELGRIAAFQSMLRFPLPPPPPRLSAPAVTAAVDAYERVLISAYRPPVSRDRHPQFIAASAALKAARELAAAGSAEGALWAYLKARRFGTAITRAGEPVPALNALRASLITESGVREEDDSLRCRLLEQVATLLEGEEIAEDERRLAAALLQDVIPESARLLSGTVAASPARTSSPTPAVKVTLVRWPYT